MTKGKYIRTQETLKKMSESHKGKKGYWFGKIGHPQSIETRKKISLAHLGIKNHFYGKKHSAETLLKMSEAHRGAISKRKGKKYPETSGISHFAWKGNKVGYLALHSWVSRNKGRPHFCEECGDKTLNHRQYHWSNISGEYKRDLNDWRRLCVKCHFEYDKAILGSKKYEK